MAFDRIIRIFIGSSIPEFQFERAELDSYIADLSERFFEDRYNVRVKAERCEKMDPAVSSYDSKQHEYNEEMIGRSDICIFMFFTRVGEYTQAEFADAVRRYKESGEKPKVYVYFKTVPDGVTVHESIETFKRALDTTFGHYYGSYDHLDTIKLRILLCLKLSEEGFCQVDFKDGGIRVNGQPYAAIDISKVAEFEHNEGLRALQAEFESVNAEYLVLHPQYKDRQDDAAFYHQYVDVAAKRQRLLNSIEELRRNIFKLSLRLSEDETHGLMTDRMKEAYRLLEAGDSVSCLRLLDENVLWNEYQHRKLARLEEAKLDATYYIRENRIAINLLHTMIERPDRFDEISRRYQSAVAEAAEYRVELGVLFDYANYLLKQNQSLDAIRVAEQLLALYKDNDNVSDYDRALLVNLMGLMYTATNPKIAESLFDEALNIYRKLAIEKPATYSSGVAAVCNNLGLLADTIDSKKAEHMYLEALGIYHKLSITNTRVYNSDIAVVYTNLGRLYCKKHNYVDAEKNCCIALSLFRQLAQNKPNEYKEKIALVSCILALIYREMGKCEESEKLYHEAVNKYRALAYDNPAAYETSLAITYIDYGELLLNCNRINDAEKNYLNALAIFHKYADSNPQFDVYIATCCHGLGTLYHTTNKTEEAVKQYNEALRIYRTLSETNPAAYESYIAMTCNNLGYLYDLKKEKGAIKLFNEALGIYQKLSLNNPDIYESDLAVTLYNIGGWYNNNGNLTEADKYYVSSLEIYYKLKKSNPAKYKAIADDVDTSFFNNTYALCYYSIYTHSNEEPDPDKLFALATEAIQKKRLDIYRKLADENPATFATDLKKAYLNLYEFYAMDNDEPQKAEAILLEILDMFTKLETLNIETSLSDKANVYGMLSVLYAEELHNYQKAESYFEKTLEMFKKCAEEDADYLDDVAKVYEYLGNIYKEMGNMEKSVDCYTEAKKIYARIEDNQ